MNESQLTSAFLKRLKGRGFLTHKSSERFVAGWPDALVVGGGRTVFLEFKQIPVRKDPFEKATPLQKKTMLELYVASEGRALFVGFMPRDPRGQQFLRVTRGNGSPIGVLDESELVALIATILREGHGSCY
jgi:hypothetical protein